MPTRRGASGVLSDLVMRSYLASAARRPRRRQQDQGEPTVAQLIKAEEERLGVDALTLVQKAALIDRAATELLNKRAAPAPSSGIAVSASSDAYPASWNRPAAPKSGGGAIHEAPTSQSGAEADYPAGWDVSALDVGGPEGGRGRTRHPVTSGSAGSRAGIDYPADWKR